VKGYLLELTTVGAPPFEQGRPAAALLLGLIAGERPPGLIAGERPPETTVTVNPGSLHTANHRPDPGNH
jgi:DNA-binding LacI/PurR family transcriptional regulator